MDFASALLAVKIAQRPFVYIARYENDSFYIGASYAGLVDKYQWGSRLYTARSRHPYPAQYTVEFFDTEEQARTRQGKLIAHYRANPKLLNGLRGRLRKCRMLCPWITSIASCKRSRVFRLGCKRSCALIRPLIQ